jgi:uncharacterized alpha/beta hydrolase family protein
VQFQKRKIIGKMNIYVLVIILIFGIIILFAINEQIKKRKEGKQSWKVSKRGRDGIVYSQKVDGEWKSIEVDGELLLGKISHVIYFKTENEWTGYPKWAQNRTEIISRIKIVFPPARTEYENA